MSGEAEEANNPADYSAEAALVSPSGEKRFVANYTIDIKKDFDTVKVLVFDHDKCPNWNRSVDRIDLLEEGKNNGIGSARRCYFYAGGTVQEVVHINTDDTCGLFITDDSEKKPAPMKYLGPMFKVEKIDDETTKLSSQMFYLPKLMPLTYPMGMYLLKKPMGETVWGHAAGIKYYCEKGEIVTDKTDLGIPDLDNVTIEYKEM